MGAFSLIVVINLLNRCVMTCRLVLKLYFVMHFMCDNFHNVSNLETALL